MFGALITLMLLSRTPHRMCHLPGFTDALPLYLRTPRRISKLVPKVGADEKTSTVLCFEVLRIAP